MKFNPGDLAYFKPQGIIVEILFPADPSYTYYSLCGRAFRPGNRPNHYVVVSLGKPINLSWEEDGRKYYSKESSVAGWALVPLRYQEGNDETLAWKSVPLPTISKASK